MSMSFMFYFLAIIKCVSWMKGNGKLKYKGTTSRLSSYLQRGTTLVTHCLLPWTAKPFEMGSTLKGKILLP